MQEAACLNFCNLKDDITITATRRCSHNIFVEWKRNEGDEDQQVYRGCNRTHTLRTADEVSKTLKGAMDVERPYISFLMGLLMSLPLRPALMNVGPSHRISA